MPRPDNPYAPRRPGEDLTEVLRRLDLMERKLCLLYTSPSPRD